MIFLVEKTLIAAILAELLSVEKSGAEDKRNANN